MELQTQPTVCGVCIFTLSDVFLVSLAGSEEERSRVDPVSGKILTLYTVVVVGSKYM